MIDGVPQSTPLRNGSVDLRTIDPYVLEWIEVLRGATALYGNGAAGGIINHITRKNFSDKKVGGKSEIGATGFIINSNQSIGARFYQSIFGKIGKFNYTTSGSFEQTGIQRDAKGEGIGPLYGMRHNEINNYFLKTSYDLTDSQSIHISYNYFGSRDKTNLIEKTGSIKEERKTSAVFGEKSGAAPGTRFNHNAMIKYTNLGIIKNTSLNFTGYIQKLSTVFQYSNQFEGGGQSTIQSDKQELRLDLNTSVYVNPKFYVNISYGLDVLRDNAFQPLLDGRNWVPNMDMVSVGPFVQLQCHLLNNIIINTGVRFENINISVKDFNTLKPLNRVTSTFGDSKFVTGGNLKYNNVASKFGVRYNKFNLFKPFVNFSQGFSVADLGLVLRSSTAPDISKIKTDAVVINNYEAGFTSRFNFLKLEASVFMSNSKLGSSYQEINGVYEIVRSPERVWGYKIAADLKLQSKLDGGVSFTWVEGQGWLKAPVVAMISIQTIIWEETVLQHLNLLLTFDMHPHSMYLSEPIC